MRKRPVAGGRRAALVIMAVAMGLATTLGGCRSKGPPPIEQLAVSRSAIEDALQAGAADDASAELASATQKLDRARRLSASGDLALARRLAEQAELDARLAAVKARNARAQRELQRAEEHLRLLEQRATPSVRGSTTSSSRSP